MTAFGKLIRTTAFKLTLIYLTIFALFAVFLLGYFAFNTRRLFNEQVMQTVDDDVARLSDQFKAGGLRRLVLIVESRARRPGSSLYLVTTATGEGLAGNVGALPQGVMSEPGWTKTVYRRLDESDGAEIHHALVRVAHLPGGFRLLIGRDLEERDRLYGVVLAAGRWSTAIVIVLGLSGGFFVARRALRRLDAITATTQTIMGGDLSGRLPVVGTGDELDRLAENINAMLDRIEALMRGLKEVSDNIAHDLKTPLTRLRNRAEEALRGHQSEAGYRESLEGIIEESEGLIGIFNALLMIARAEAGQAREGFAEFDASRVARDVGELYEPLAEEKGLALVVDAPKSVGVTGNRELISQALANLVDNAIKYAAPEHPEHGAAAQIVVKAEEEGAWVLLSVADRGPGIPEQERGRAVERFVRLEKSRSVPGSGLGLSLVSAVAHLHGGELRLEDHAPGLRVILALPRGGPQGAG